MINFTIIEIVIKNIIIIKIIEIIIKYLTTVKIIEISMWIPNSDRFDRYQNNRGYNKNNNGRSTGIRIM